MKTIVLIGTNHIYQARSPRCRPEDAQAFQRFLSEECRQHGIQTVAEEMNPQGLEMSKTAWEVNKKDWESENPDAWPDVDIESILKNCEEALEWHKEGMSIPQRVAKELSLKPLFCDPDGEQRASLEIEYESAIELERDFEHRISAEKADRRIRESRIKREQYWLKRLQEKVPESEYPVLFICGATHVESFSKLLEDNDFDVRCIRDNWEP